MLQSIYFWILAGAFGLFFGMSNPIIHVSYAVLLYPISLYMLAKISKNPFRDGMLCGLIGASFGMYWISVAVYIYGGFPLVLAIPCAMVLGAYIGLWGGIFSFVMQRMMSLSPLLRVLSAALFWYICEWLRSFVLTGFSWFTLSSAFAPIPEFIQGASLIGAFALSGVFAGIGVLFVENFTSHKTSQEMGKHMKNPIKRGLLSFGAALFMVILFVYGNVRLSNSFEGNSFLYGTDVKQPYISIESRVDGSSKTLDYQEYHENPQNIGAAKHALVLPNFLGTFFNEENGLLRLQNDILLPQAFLEQENIALFTAVQGNVSQAVKWEKSFQLATVQKYTRLSEQGLDFVKNIFPSINFNENASFIDGENISSDINSSENIKADISSDVSINLNEKPNSNENSALSTESSSLAKSSAKLQAKSPIESSVKSPIESLGKSSVKSPTPLLSIPSVVLWPETALPFDFEQASPLSFMVRDFAKNQKILFGAPGFDYDQKTQRMTNLYNRLFFLQGEELTSYDKERLVPFGEYVPQIPLMPDIFYNLLQGVGGFSVGVNDELLKLKKNKQADNQSHVLPSYSLSSLICYEAIFPQIAWEDVKNGAELFINISNDAWYDKTSAAEQHLHLSLMRAVEQKRFLVRAGNTGISAFVDDYGRIMAQSDVFTDETLSGFVAFRTEKTVYYYLAPYIPFFALSLFLLLFIYGQIWEFYLRKINILKQN